jgi:hypothetical protein
MACTLNRDDPFGGLPPKRKLDELVCHLGFVFDSFTKTAYLVVNE